MNKFRIVPLSRSYADNIRTTGVDEFGNIATEEIAKGHGPCRVSLKAFKPGEDRRILISHSPFESNNAFNQPGPVFISAENVEEYKDIHRFPPEIKNNKKSFPLTLIGYNLEQMMVYTKLVGDADVDELIERIFEKHPEVEYMHARNAEASCYICKIERVSGSG